MSDFDRFSYDEAARGFVATIGSVLFLGWKGIILAVACGILWMLGGTYLKTIRREGVPAAVFLWASFFNGFHWWYLFAALGILVLHQGDGFPDHRETTADEGSWMGRWVEAHIENDPEIGGPITKWIWVPIFALTLVPYLFR